MSLTEENENIEEEPTVQSLIDLGDAVPLAENLEPNTFIIEKDVSVFKRGDVVSPREEVSSFWKVLSDSPEEPVEPEEEQGEVVAPVKGESGSEELTEPPVWALDTVHAIEDWSGSENEYALVRVWRYEGVDSILHLEDDDFKAVMRFIYSQD